MLQCGYAHAATLLLGERSCDCTLFTGDGAAVGCLLFDVKSPANSIGRRGLV
jgi:hypothetical protein